MRRQTIKKCIKAAINKTIRSLNYVAIKGLKLLNYVY